MNTRTCKYCGKPATFDVVAASRGRYATCSAHKPSMEAAERGINQHTYNALGPWGKTLRKIAGM